MDERIRKTLDYIENNIGSSFDLKSLAQIACLSPSQFHRTFKRETKRTPHQFVEEIKLNKAYLLLTKGNDSIQKIALSLGYNDYETFSRGFKRFFKFSPDDLRSISTKLKKEIVKDQGEVIIASLDVSAEDDLEMTIKQIAERLDVSKDELMHSKIFRIEKKSEGTNGEGLIVKNKYVMKEDQKLWESILKN